MTDKPKPFQDIWMVVDEDGDFLGSYGPAMSHNAPTPEQTREFAVSLSEGHSLRVVRYTLAEVGEPVHGLRKKSERKSHPDDCDCPMCLFRALIDSGNGKAVALGVRVRKNAPDEEAPASPCDSVHENGVKCEKDSHEGLGVHQGRDASGVEYVW